jgi:hypothetical protein
MQFKDNNTGVNEQYAPDRAAVQITEGMQKPDGKQSS